MKNKTNITTYRRAVAVFGLMAVATCTSLVANAQTTKEQQMREHLSKLMSSKDSTDKQALYTELHQLAASNNELDMMMASNYYYQLGRTKVVDSLGKAELQKFPKGFAARREAVEPVYKETTAKGMEQAYLKWVAAFPPEKFRTGAVEDDLQYDYVRSAIANLYAKEKNTAKAIQYINELAVDFWKGNAYMGISNIFYANGDLPLAEKYGRMAMENADSYRDGKKGDSNAAKFAASGYPGLASAYANILFEEKKYNEALQYSEKAYKESKGFNPQISYRYAQILIGLNRSAEAYPILEAVVKSGRANPEMAKTFKEQYIKKNGSDAGYEQFAASLRKAYLDDLQKRLNHDMVKEQAAQFTLTDLNGKSVSLSDYKGKVVILDFWATWCGPCKASFPAMQMAQNKFANDPNVQFLFIHTWERVPDATTDARNYITEHKFNFEVLMDLRDKVTKKNNVVSSYNVNGIPAKFVIDPDGNIRFKLTGFDGSNEAAVDELSLMIEMAKKTKA
ncbi:redoxin domain-containing protein [Mucilaginibacter sp. KACC 22063]|uniref:redoxin domain-containing protein n=1 Tax=Mucilaginibacter sp. KACC 22063 TaxID=3025666 RepID=UPI002366D201|nr:redoxin domain-containing protein [Mucilaginibacter sp. KACC 22063]WDF57410.1 redoxin domain-containing protein [Mucilaginibacter sp. KACC 22063]